MTPFLRARPQRIAAIVVFVLLAAIGFLPLFGGPGYEHALACGLVLPAAAAIATSVEVARAYASPLACVARGVASGMWLAAIAFLTALLHGLRVGFCDFTGGAIGFAMTAGIGAILGGAWGAIAGELARGTKRTRLWCTLASLAAPLGGIAFSVWRFYASPMIFAFDPFFGYFSGTLYDTVIDPGAALVTYRVGSLASLSSLLFVASVTSRGAKSKPGIVVDRDTGRIARLAIGVALAAVSIGITVKGSALGHWQTSSTIARDLGGRRSGPRCDVVYPDGQRLEDVDLFVRDCEENLRSVEAALGARGPERITEFLFRDAGDKKRLMGAADTYIAKPWRHEVYLQVQSYPHPVLGHEIAHVVAGSFGRGPFRIAAAYGGLLPNPGLIEGVAVAASPDDDELTDAQWARAMMELEILPPMGRIFSLGFLGESSAKSYTVAGAFVRWVLEKHGAEVVRRWYGGEELAAIVGRSWDALDGEFRVWLAQQELPPPAEAYAKAKFDRPSVFGRRCPHVVDGLRRKADQCRDGLQVDKAVGLYGNVLTRDPHDFGARFGLAITRARYGDAAVGRRDLEALAKDEKAPRTWRDRAGEALADVDWIAGHDEDARARYESLAREQLDEDIGRTLEVKAYAAAGGASRASIAALLVGAPGRPADNNEAMARLGAWSEATRDPVAEYVLGKNLAQHAFWAEAAEHLDRALTGAEPTPRIARELLHQRAIVACAMRDGASLARVRDAMKSEASPFRGSSGGRRESLERLVARCAP